MFCGVVSPTLCLFCCAIGWFWPKRMLVTDCFITVRFQALILNSDQLAVSFHYGRA